jgi:two-component system sensor histidine kinase FlrB
MNPESLIKPESDRVAPLHDAFALFVEASNSLERQYSELAKQVSLLSADLVRANSRLSTVLNALPAAVIVLEDGLVSHFNKAAEHLLPLLRHGAALSFPEYWVRGNSDSEFVITTTESESMVQVMTVYDGTRSVIQIQDITENVRSRQERERLDRLASMGHMSAGIAHQFRTPLATAMLYSGNLRKASFSDEQQALFAEKLHRQLERLTKLSEEMLQFVNVRAKPFKLCDIDEIIDAAITEIDGPLQNTNIVLTRDSKGEKFFVNADLHALVSALVAVLENAVEHTPEGGEIAIQKELSSQLCKLRIIDSGSGITPEILPRLFEPFASGKSTGTGLGLAIAKNTLRAHGGNIEARNVSEGGSEFIIKLPGNIYLD